MCAFMASGGIVFFFSSVSVYNGFGLRNKLRDGPLHNEKARGIFFSPAAFHTSTGDNLFNRLTVPNRDCWASYRHVQGTRLPAGCIETLPTRKPLA